MSKRRAFVSFDYDHDLRLKNLFCGQIHEGSPTPFSAEDWSSKRTLPEAQWKKLIESKIARCHFMIVLVGRHMGSASGVSEEIALARRAQVPIFGVYVDGAGFFSTLPAGLRRSQMVKWQWPLIRSRIDRCITRGENAD